MVQGNGNASSSSTVGHSTSPPPKSQRRKQRWRLKEDYRGRLPSFIARFTGYRPPGTKPPYDPIAPLSFLKRIPLKYEIWIIATFAAFVGILAVASLSAPGTGLPVELHTQVIVASFGASAVLVYGAVEAPLSQPRNAVGGQIISAIVAVCVTRLIAINTDYETNLESSMVYHVRPIMAASLAMSMALLAMFVTGTVHPPGGATAVLAATSITSVRMEWRFIYVVIVSSLVMLGWAMFINNIGRRRYPVYWWSPERTFVRDQAPEPREDEEVALGQMRDGEAMRAVDGGRTEEAFQVERAEGEGGSPAAIQQALSRDRQPSAA